MMINRRLLLVSVAITNAVDGYEVGGLTNGAESWMSSVANESHQSKLSDQLQQHLQNSISNNSLQENDLSFSNKTQSFGIPGLSDGFFGSLKRIVETGMGTYMGTSMSHARMNPGAFPIAGPTQNMISRLFKMEESPMPVTVATNPHAAPQMNQQMATAYPYYYMPQVYPDVRVAPPNMPYSTTVSYQPIPPYYNPPYETIIDSKPVIPTPVGAPIGPGQPGMMMPIPPPGQPTMVPYNPGLNSTAASNPNPSTPDYITPLTLSSGKPNVVIIDTDAPSSSNESNLQAYTPYTGEYDYKANKYAGKYESLIGTGLSATANTLSKFFDKKANPINVIDPNPLRSLLTGNPSHIVLPEATMLPDGTFLTQNGPTASSYVHSNMPYKTRRRLEKSLHKLGYDDRYVPKIESALLDNDNVMTDVRRITNTTIRDARSGIPSDNSKSILIQELPLKKYLKSNDAPIDEIHRNVYSKPNDNEIIYY